MLKTRLRKQRDDIRYSLTTFGDSDIFSNFQIGAMLYAEAYKGPWTISSDRIYMKIGSDVSSKNNILSGNVTAKQLGWELAGLYKIKPWLDGGIGERSNP